VWLTTEYVQSHVKELGVLQVVAPQARMWSATVNCFASVTIYCNGDDPTIEIKINNTVVGHQASHNTLNTLDVLYHQFPCYLKKGDVVSISASSSSYGIQSLAISRVAFWEY